MVPIVWYHRTPSTVATGHANHPPPRHRSIVGPMAPRTKQIPDGRSSSTSALGLVIHQVWTAGTMKDGDQRRDQRNCRQSPSPDFSHPQVKYGKYVWIPQETTVSGCLVGDGILETNMGIPADVQVPYPKTGCYWCPKAMVWWSSIFNKSCWGGTVQAWYAKHCKEITTFRGRRRMEILKSCSRWIPLPTGCTGKWQMDVDGRTPIAINICISMYYNIL